MGNVARRNAFTYAFMNYPVVLLSLVKDGHVHLHDTKKNCHVEIVTQDTENEIALVLMAQFFTRLIQTRCVNAGTGLEVFANETVTRYRKFTKEHTPPDMEVRCLTSRLGALAVIEQSISETLFTALAEEVRICEEAGGLEEFSEKDFWVDFFLCFNATTRPGHPRWTIAAQDIFLNNRDDFDAALKEFPGT